MKKALIEVWNFGPFRLDQASYRLTRRIPGDADELITLRPKAFDVLRHLVENAGRTISQDEFLSELWPEANVQPEVLKSHVLAVREALDDRSTFAEARYIETVRGRGYRFIADVRCVWEGEASERLENPGCFLVGRKEALEELEGSLTRARSGEAQIVFVTGEPGIGKTTLAETFVKTTTADGVMVVAGHCLPGSGATDAYYPLLEMLTTLSGGKFGTTLKTVIAQYAPAWLVQLPGLMTPGVSDLRHVVIDATPHRMARELCDALDALARSRGLVILLEDLHWADQATLDLIQALASRKLRTRLMIVATLRSSVTTDAGRSAGMLAQKLSLYRLAREIRLEPLSLANVEAFLCLLSQAAPPEKLSKQLHLRSEGNPLIMRAILDVLLQRGEVSWDEDGWRLGVSFEPLGLRVPPSLAQIIEAEIDDLPGEAQSVLEAASVSDGPFSPFINHVASTCDEQTFESVCESLCRRGQLIRRSDVIEMPAGRLVQTYSFRHALFQEVAYDRQGAVRRAGAHAVVARHMADVYGPDLSAAASSLARHFLQAGLWSETIHFLRLSARTMMQRFAHREAATLLEQAISFCRNLPSNERWESELGALEEVATIYLGVSDSRAAETYDRLSRLARDHACVDVEARALIGLSYALSWIDSEPCLAIMSQVLSKSSDIADPVQRALVRCGAHGWLSYMQGWSAADAAGVRTEMEKLRELGNSVAFHSSLVYYALILFSEARYVESTGTIATGISFLVAHGNEARVDLGLPLWVSRLAPWAKMAAGQLGEALEGYTTGAAAYEGNGDLYRSATLRLYHAFLYARMHDHRAALNMLDETIALIRAQGANLSPNDTRVELVIRGLAELGLEEVEAALTHLNAAETEMRARNTLSTWYWRLALQWGLTDAYLAVGDLISAETSAKHFLERACAIEERSWRALAGEASARVALARGDAIGARGHLSLAWAQIEGYDAGLMRWRLYSVEACVSDRLGESDSAARHRQSRTGELEALAATLPPDHPGRITLLAAQPFLPRPPEYRSAAGG